MPKGNTKAALLKITKSQTVCNRRIKINVANGTGYEEERQIKERPLNAMRNPIRKEAYLGGVTKA